MRLTCFCVGLYRLPLVPLILPAASISPSARRWFRPHYILGIRAAVPFVNKPLRFYPSSWEPQIARNSEYVCVVCVVCVAILRGKGTTKRYRSAFDRFGLQCHSFSLSLSRCQYGTQRITREPACQGSGNAHGPASRSSLVCISRDVMSICLVVVYLQTLVVLFINLRLMGRFVNHELETMRGRGLF